MSLTKESRGLLRIIAPVLVLLGLSSCEFIFEFEQTEPTILEITGPDTCPGITDDITLTVHCDYKWTAFIGGVGWARIVSQSSTSSKEGVVVLQFDANDGSEERSCEIVLSSGTRSTTKIITQNCMENFFSPEEIILSGTEASPLCFNSPFDWTVTVAEGQDWIKLQDASGAPGQATVLVSAVDANENVGSRSGKLNVNIGKDTFTIPVTQGQKDVVLADGATVSVGFKGGEFTIVTSSNVNYKVEVSDRWLQHISTKALNQASELFSASRNTDVNPRKGTIRFTGIDNPEASVTVTVNQDGIDPMLLNTTPGLYGLDGQTYTFGKNGWNLSSRVQNADGSFEYRILSRSSLSAICITGIDPDAAEGSVLSIHVDAKQKADTFFSQSYSASVLGSDEELMWLVVNDSVLLVIQK